MHSAPSPLVSMFVVPLLIEGDVCWLLAWSGLGFLIRVAERSYPYDLECVRDAECRSDGCFVKPTHPACPETESMSSEAEMLKGDGGIGNVIFDAIF